VGHNQQQVEGEEVGQVEGEGVELLEGGLLNMLDMYVDRYVYIVNYHLVMIVACCLSNFGQNMD
jgi:hypothetical protein